MGAAATSCGSSSGPTATAPTAASATATGPTATAPTASATATGPTATPSGFGFTSAETTAAGLKELALPAGLSSLSLDFEGFTAPRSLETRLLNQFELVSLGTAYEGSGDVASPPVELDAPAETAQEGEVVIKRSLFAARWIGPSPPTR